MPFPHFGQPHEESTVIGGDPHRIHEALRGHVYARYRVVGDDPASLAIWFEAPMSMWTWGEDGYAKVVPGDGAARVVVIVKPKMPTVVMQWARARKISSQIFGAVAASVEGPPAA